ncbi:MAG: hypothetical protein AAF717_09715 [Bacteroidota bacterium]
MESPELRGETLELRKLIKSLSQRLAYIQRISNDTRILDTCEMSINEIYQITGLDTSKDQLDTNFTMTDIKNIRKAFEDE